MITLGKITGITPPFYVRHIARITTAAGGLVMGASVTTTACLQVDAAGEQKMITAARVQNEC